MLALFPDARLVIAERDLDAVFKSAVSLSANQMAVQSDACDLEQIEALWRHKLALREERLCKVLAQWSGPMVRLSFEALNADWEREIARTYHALDAHLSPPALSAMRVMMARSESGHHHAHSAQLRDIETRKTG